MDDVVNASTVEGHPLSAAELERIHGCWRQPIICLSGKSICLTPVRGKRRPSGRGRIARTP